ncbi:hypothetical protein GPECTOR_3g431 [Gonium pectorale]|uniref:Uncharacterized protein n=1 Tax=Gonium pectorale TaxID=33097 RepID=A0A150GZF3_GONPE|nr:hypothetical protein GPECTOR_3g431 [Gonium pectorale]|eukprot:KXZ55296.1 hypothetical protein GPECTOR_3g431 [Gonium pectorale]
MLTAARGGHRHVCEWLLASDPRALHGHEIGVAARSGHLELAEWLLHLCPVPTGGGYLFGVGYSCDLPALQRAWARFRQPGLGPTLLDWSEDLICEAAGSPTPDWAAKVEWLEAQGCPRTSEVTWEAAGLRNDGEALARLTWLRGREYPVDERAVDGAACAGNTAALQYLLTEVAAPAVAADSYQLDPVLSAVKHGHLAALQALHAARWHTRVPDAVVGAAEAGHIAHARADLAV